MQCNETPRTCSIERERWALEVKDVRDAVGENGLPNAYQQVLGHDIGVLHHHRLIVVGERRDIYAGTGSLDAFCRYTGALESFECDFEQEALLGVHGGSFASRDTEESRIEGGNVLIDEVTATVVGRSLHVCIGVVERAPGKPVGRRFRPCVFSFGEQLPQLVRIVGAPREAATDADHGNWDWLVTHFS